MGKSWLNNKKVIITGASSGIGRELTEILVKNYDCTVLGVSRNREKAENFALELNSERYGYKCFDVSIEQNWIDFVAFLNEESFFPDVVINNAGILPTFKSVNKTGIEEFKKVFDIDFWSAVYSLKYLEPLIALSKTPTVINVSSSSALAILAGTAPYTSAKTALRTFTECCGVEYKKFYIGVVCPGFTKTNIFRSQKQGIDEGIIGKVCMPASKLAKKIVRGIKRRKKRMVFGLDSKIMNFTYKLFPRGSAKLFASVMKKSKLEIFNDIFCD